MTCHFKEDVEPAVGDSDESDQIDEGFGKRSKWQVRNV